MQHRYKPPSLTSAVILVSIFLIALFSGVLGEGISSEPINALFTSLKQIFLDFGI